MGEGSESRAGGSKVYEGVCIILGHPPAGGGQSAFVNGVNARALLMDLLSEVLKGTF